MQQKFFLRIDNEIKKAPFSRSSRFFTIISDKKKHWWTLKTHRMKRLYLSALGTKHTSDWSSCIFFHKSIDIFAQGISNIRITEQSDRIWSTTLQQKNFAGCRILAWSTVRQEIALLSPVFERITFITSTYGRPFIMDSFLFHVKIPNLIQFLTS